ncbi:lipoprotein signal peptidase [Paenibacillus sp. CCS19]|uniref:signal peptidase II n=1 Tax=Paenibacillus sp. CCS19 TaxID=3158387 RepID=UPI00256A8B02|nr:signal peptidase II [Paenibacillus cellulosilyticus]GMK40168.1 lipoprotein signal peptidase [Paenibacillus cellulosilyticus]
MLRLLFYLVISGITFLVDYISKKVIVNELDLYEQVHVIGDFFVITSIRNTGAAFSLLEDQRVFFLIITTVVTIALVSYMTYLTRKQGRAVLLTGLAMVLGGALGNFIDRARSGEVVDFLQFTFGSYTFAIFNLADTGIFIGVCLIILDSLLAARAEKQAYVDKAIAASYLEPKQPQE